MGEVYYKCASLDQWVEIEKINQNQIHHIQNSPLIAPTVTRPCYVQLTEMTFQTYPTITEEVNVVCNHIARPATVRWGYTIVNDKALYNPAAAYTTHFELHESEETDLVIKILASAVITIKDQLVSQYGAQEDMKNAQQEKQ